MKKVYVFIFAVLFGAINTTYSDDLIDSTIPLFSQKLQFKIKKGWKVGSQQSNQGVFLLELIPENEQIDTWTQLLVISAYKGMASRLSAHEAYKVEAESVVRSCPADAINSIIKLPNAQGYDAVSAIVYSARS